MLGKRLKQIKNNSNGFTLLEIVIAVGVLLIISSVGTVAVKNVDDAAKDAAVKRAAKEVYSAARAKVEDGSSRTKAQDAADEYNSSQTARTNNNNRHITVKVIQTSPSNPNELRVEAYYDGGRINAFYDGSTEGIVEPSLPGGGGVTVPVIEDTVSQLTYNCNTATTGHLPIFNISDSTTVSLVGSDGSEKLIDYQATDLTKVESGRGTLSFIKAASRWDNISEKITMNPGVTYTVKVYGKFDNFSAINEYTSDTTNGKNISFRDCLVSVDKLGAHSGLRSMNWIGSTKLTNVPDSIPSTVTDLDCLFANATIFNDPDVAKWDVKNVTTLYYTFLYADVFDQNMNGWNTKNTKTMLGTFYSAKKFNNGGQQMLWDTSNATTLASMFAYAYKFNQSVTQFYDSQTATTYWNTSKVTTMTSTFAYAYDFNNGYTGAVASTPRLNWNTTSVTSMTSMFKEARSFNALITTSGNYWNMSSVKNFTSMFEGATLFNRGIGNWNTSNVTNMTSMFKNSGFNQPLSGWNTSKVTSMKEMFNGASKFNQPLNTWDVAKVSVANRDQFNTGTLMENKPTYQPQWVL